MANDLREFAAAEAARLGLDPQIALNMISAESSWNPAAIGPVIPGRSERAIGLTQLLPSTAKDLGVNPHDAKQNITGGFRYLRQNLDRFGGDYEKALASHNWGPNALDKFGMEKAPPATRDYIRKIMPNATAQAASPLDDLVRQFSQTGVAKQAGATSASPLDDLVKQFSQSASNQSAQQAEAVSEPTPAPGNNPQPLRIEVNGVANEPSVLYSLGQAVTRGVRDVIDRPAQYLASQFSPQEGARVAALNQQGEREYADSKIPYLSEGIRMGGQMAATAPLVAATGAGAGLAAPQLGKAIASFGMGGGNIGTRAAGGATAGAISSAAVSPDDMGTNAAIGAGIGATVPIVGRAANLAGGAVANFVRPFTESGRERIAGALLRSSAEDPVATIARLKSAQTVVPGSAPTSAMASGDFGLSATLNAIQDKLPDVGAAARRAADNRQQARATFGQTIGGDQATIDLAKAARDAATDPIRAAALKNAAGIPAATLTGPIDKLMAAPQMQGETVQAALAKVRGNIDRISNNGVVNPTALYEIRKDINLLMEGRLAGDDANLKFARQPLMAIKNLIDNRIDQASPTSGAWKNYLSTFASQSKDIGQMQTVQDVLRRAGTGTVDTAGNPVITPAQLNRILKNEGSDLAKQLTPQQMDGLRKLAADLSAEQLAASASRSSTMNSVTNKLTETNKAIDAGLGFVPGGGMLQNILSGVQSGNKGKVMGLLGDSVLNPNLAAYLMQQGAPTTAPAGAVPQLSKALAAQLMLRGAPLAVPNAYRPNAAMQLETQR
jgi:hypothetical protein